ncbi:MAG: PEP-CTERM sorting domain-containing protein [Sulfuriferula sp.]|nr:PEP-CTERM sorting domain-containing protein [Sulfuriferula sp.]
MQVIKSIKLLSVAAVAAMSFAGDAGAVTVTGPGGSTIVVTGIGSGNGTWYKVPAVPEADTWAMMAVGLGLVGLRLRRKGKKSQNVAAN